MEIASDIIIVGAGLVGTSLIAVLKNAPFRITVLETHIPVQESPDPDLRPLSLTYSSQRILDTLGIWPELSQTAELIQTVHVSEENRLGVLRFRAAEEKVLALGYVVAFDALQNCLYQRAAETETVKFITIQKLSGIDYQNGKVLVTVQTAQGEKILPAELLVAADGTFSPTRKLLGIGVSEESHDDIALTMTMELMQPHAHTAYERFTAKGVIAILPLKNPLRCRIVWVTSRSFAGEVSQWPDQQLAKYLSAALHDRLGEWRVLERGKSFPLQTVIAKEQIRKGVVLLGNAAHTIYPLAAQGFNLGLRDAVTLAEILIDAKNGHNIGDERILRSYLDWRSADQRWITSLTTGMGQLFDLRLPGLGTLRGAGLLATDLFPPLKHRLAKRFLGLAGKCPKLIRGISL